MKLDSKENPHKAKKASPEQLLIQDLKSQLSRADERVDKMESLLQAIALGLTKQNNLNQFLMNAVGQNAANIRNLSKFVDGLANEIKEEMQNE